MSDNQQGRDKDDSEAVALSDASDICAQLMERYAKSSAPQHRHLLASAVAMRSILEAESLPLTPAAYFAAAISAIDNASASQTLVDPTALSALFSFLAFTLPLVPPAGISAPNASEAVALLVVLLGMKSLTVSTVRAEVKCLGILLGFCNLEDWGSVKLGFDTLLKFSVDRRPKVRRCAQDSLITFLNSLKHSAIKKEASKLVFSLLETCMPSAIKLSTITLVDGRPEDNQSNGQHLDVLHILNVIILAIPLLSNKVRFKVLKELIKLVNPQFSLVTGHSFKAIELILKSSDAGVIALEVESLIVSIGSYLYLGDKNPLDTVLSATTLLKCAMNAGGSSVAIRNFPVVCGYMAGLLTSDVSKALHASSVLKELIEDHLIDKDPHLEDCYVECIEVQAIKSTCAILEDALNSYDGDLGKYILDVISALFLKLGTTSFVYMRHILVKLADLMNISGNIPNVDNLQNCIGSAVTAMGPEKILTLIPISFNAGNLTVQNTWLVPILRSHVVGASLGYYLEYIVPLAKSFQQESSKVKKIAVCKKLQTCAFNLWRLLPAFCRHPSDMHQSIGMLTELLITLLKEDSFMHEDIAVALQVLVNQNTVVPNFNDVSVYSKKLASKNMKALVSFSANLLQHLAKLFVDSVPTKRSHLKDAIGCLASITDSRMTKKVFMSLLEKFQFLNTKGDFEEPKANAEELAQNAEGNSGTREIDLQRCVMLELASAIIKGAKEDLIDLIYNFAKFSFQASSDLSHHEAYQTMSRILEEHAWFASSRFSELVDMLIDLQSPVDTSSQRSRFACFHILLVHSLKVNSAEESNKAFLMLNEIIVALKSAEEDSRKAAYDVLHCISCSLKDSSHTNFDAHQNFVAMISGYLSGASPHVKSGAISALSVLVYDDADICLSIPDLVPSLLSLLRGRAIEVIKAVLGFVKVLVSSLQAKNLQSIISDILLAVLPWSSGSRHHFRSKVTIILEILIRKCGYAAIEGVSPEKYKGFIKALWQKRNDNKSSSKDAGDDAITDVADSSTNGARDKQKDGLDSLPKKNVSGHHRKRKWEKSSDFVGSKTDDTLAEDGGRSKMNKRAATSSNKRISLMDGLADSHKASFSRHGAPRKGGKRGGIEHGNRNQKERNGVRRPVKASKFHHKN